MDTPQPVPLPALIAPSQPSASPPAPPLSLADCRELEIVALAAARLGAEVATAHFAHLEELVVETKTSSFAGRAEVVTRADREVEAAIASLLATARPADLLLGEEGGMRPLYSEPLDDEPRDAPGTGVTWCVDPIDATANFTRARPHWAVSVAALGPDGTPVAAAIAAPALSETFHAARGLGAFRRGEPLAVAPTSHLADATIELGAGRAHRAALGAIVTELMAAGAGVRRSGCAALALAHVADGSLDACYAPDLEPWDCAAGVLIAAEAGALVSLTDSVLVVATPRVHRELCRLLDRVLTTASDPEVPMPRAPTP